MSVPSEVMVNIKPTQGKGRVMTKHVTYIKRYTVVQSSHHMPRNTETIVEDDELEEEIGQ